MDMDFSATVIILILGSPLIALAIILRLKLSRDFQHSGETIQTKKLPGKKLEELSTSPESPDAQRTIFKNEKDREAVRKMADSMRIVFFLALVISASDLYRFMSASGEIRQGISIALGILGTILVWLMYRELRAEKKQALSFWLAAVLLGYFRWIFIDATFDVNIISIILIFLVIVFTLRLVIWTRSGVLT